MEVKENHSFGCFDLMPQNFPPYLQTYASRHRLGCHNGCDEKGTYIRLLGSLYEFWPFAPYMGTCLACGLM